MADAFLGVAGQGFSAEAPCGGPDHRCGPAVTARKNRLFGQANRLARALIDTYAAFTAFIRIDDRNTVVIHLDGFRRAYIHAIAATRTFVRINYRRQVLPFL
jgi:hypothetical protein